MAADEASQSIALAKDTLGDAPLPPPDDAATTWTRHMFVHKFFFWDARCVLSFLILFSEQYFHSNLGTMFLAQCLWAFNYNVETMLVARCFWAFNYNSNFILTCLFSYLAWYYVTACDPCLLRSFSYHFFFLISSTLVTCICLCELLLLSKKFCCDLYLLERSCHFLLRQ